MTAAWEILVLLLCAYAAVIGVTIGMDLWRWFWSDE